MHGEMFLRVYARGEKGSPRVVAESKMSVSIEHLVGLDDPAPAVREVLRALLRRAEADLVVPPPELREGEDKIPEAVEARERAGILQENVYGNIVKTMTMNSGPPDLDVLHGTPQEGCDHVIADARNERVTSGYVCLKCAGVFQAGDHDEGQIEDRDAEVLRAVRTVYRLENDPSTGGALQSFLVSVRGLLSELLKRRAAERRSSGPKGSGGS